MEYFFIPGRLKNLSWAELDAVCATILGSKYSLADKGEYFILSTTSDSSKIYDIFRRLGGFLKYGELLSTDTNITELLKSQKVVFGISSYDSETSFDDVKKLSHKLKKEYSHLGKKVRFVLPKEQKSLSTSQVLKNKLIIDGMELVVFKNQIGRTLAVQDFEAFSIRDYEKPFVDSKMGVLPIKLARIMVNLAKIKPDGCIWDPFCGSGNILLEGLDLGYDVLGSDIDEKALEGSKKNIKWAKNFFKYKNRESIFYLDVSNPTPSKLDILRRSNINGVICEPYMGKPQRRTLNVNQAQALIKQHYNLVQALFFILDNLKLKEEIRVVVVFPEYKTKEGWISIEKSKLNFKNTKLLEKDLHWSRVSSIIKRLIFVFEYNSK